MTPAIKTSYITKKKKRYFVSKVKKQTKTRYMTFYQHYFNENMFLDACILLTVGNSKVRPAIPTSLVSELLRNVHVRMDLLSHLLQDRAEIILPELLIQKLQQLAQLDFTAVVPRLLIFIITVLLSVADRQKHRSHPTRLQSLFKLIISRKNYKELLNKLYM